MSSTQIDLIPLTINDTQIKKVESKWKGHYFTAELSGMMFTFRVLKMNQSLFIHIAQSDNDVLDELAMAVPVNDFVGTTIIGTQYGCDSQDLSQQITKRLKKQCFVSCNTPSNNSIRLALVKRIVEEINQVPSAFWCDQILI